MLRKLNAHNHGLPESVVRHDRSGVGQKRAEETRIAELERKIGPQVLEIEFLKQALQHVEQQRLLRAAGGAPFTKRSSAK